MEEHVFFFFQHTELQMTLDHLQSQTRQVGSWLVEAAVS